MTLWEKLQEIEDAIEGILKGVEFHVSVRSIIIGDRIRVGDARPPGIWVFINDSPIETAGGLSETWRLQFVVAATYMSSDLKEAKKNAQRLAATASQALMKNRTLNCTVRDVTRTNYSPGMPRIEGNKKIFGAGFSMTAVFRYTPEL